MANDKVLILLDKRWDLEDFAVLTKEYMQLYAFFYTNQQQDISTQADGRVGFSAMPWQGGHSVVHFFHGSFDKLPEAAKPKVSKIQYASPGFIELAAIYEVCKEVAMVISSIAGSLYVANKAYHNVMICYRQREWAKYKSANLEIANKKNEIELINMQLDTLKNTMSLSSEQMQQLDILANGDELVKLKMLLAVYRRAEPLAKLQAEQKAVFKND